MKKIRIGMINWDASLTRDTYFGYYQTESLSQTKYRTWCRFTQIFSTKRGSTTP